jgi:hypothetical protein
MEITSMSQEPARNFVDQVRRIAAAAEPASPEQALEAFRQRVHAILGAELKFAEVEWTERRDLTFAVEDRYFRLVFDPNDPLFLSIYGGAIGRFTDEPSRIRALEAASSASHDLKVVKLVAQRVDDDWLAAASVEVLLPSLDTVDKVFIRRLVRMLEGGINEFRKRYAQPAGSSS